MMIKNRIKKGMAVLLAILIFMGILPSDTARAAAGDKLKLQENYVDFNLGTDIRLYPLVVADDNPLDSGRVSAVMTHELQNAQNETVVWGYCLEPNATTAQGDTYEEAKNYASGYADKIRRENPAMYKEMCRLIWIADTLMARGFGGYTKVQICGAGFSPWAGKIPWRRKWQPIPVLLPGKSHGWRSLVGYRWRSLVGYSPWGRKESDTTERLHLDI